MSITAEPRPVQARPTPSWGRGITVDVRTIRDQDAWADVVDSQTKQAAVEAARRGMRLTGAAAEPRFEYWRRNGGPDLVLAYREDLADCAIVKFAWETEPDPEAPIAADALGDPETQMISRVEVAVPYVDDVMDAARQRYAAMRHAEQVHGVRLDPDTADDLGYMKDGLVTYRFMVLP